MLSGTVIAKKDKKITEGQLNDLDWCYRNINR